MSKQFPYAFLKGKNIKSSEAFVPLQSKAVQYGLGIFTGIRGHWNPDHKNLYLFRLKDHHKRLQNAAKITGLKFNYSYAKFQKTIIKLVKKNKAKEDIYLRPTIYAASTKLTPRFDNKDDDLGVYMISLKNYFNSNKGLNVCISSWRKFDDAAISTKAKITGAYANSALAKTEAIQNGYDEALLLNSNGNLSEATGANIFGIKNDTVYTPPLSANILNGITRSSVIELFQKELGLKVKEQNIDRSTLYTFDELFLTGTAAKIAHISHVDNRPIANRKMGPHTQKIRDLLTKIASGQSESYKDWLVKVY